MDGWNKGERGARGRETTNTHKQTHTHRKEITLVGLRDGGNGGGGGGGGGGGLDGFDVLLFVCLVHAELLLVVGHRGV